MDLFELTTVERCPETVDPAAVDISLIFISRPKDLVEIAWGKPGHPGRWFLCQQLGKESIFARVVRGAIDGRDFEKHVSPSHPDHGGEAIRREADARNIHKEIIPEHQDATPSARRRSLREATQPMPPQEGCRELVIIFELSLLEAHDMARRRGGNRCIHHRSSVRAV